MINALKTLLRLKVRPIKARQKPPSTDILLPLITALLSPVAWAQTPQPATTASSSISQAIPGVLAAHTPLEFIKDGFNGTEGPVTLPDGSLIFTETRANRIVRIAADGSTSTFLENSNGSNGLGFTPEGDLVSVQTVKPQVGVVHPASRVRVMADSFNGKSLVRPNDLVVDGKGGVYFTDPGPGGSVSNEAAPSTKPAVYYIPPRGVTIRIADDIERPNGIQLSPDEKTLYVANTNGEFVLAYDIKTDGGIQSRRNFARLAGWKEGENGSYNSGADGLAIDAAGRLYVASNAGIEIFTRTGDALGRIPLPVKPQNLAFAGLDKKTLYIVGRGAAYRIVLQTPGYAGRAK